MDTSNFDVLFSTRLGGAALFGSSMTVLLQPQPDPGSSSGGSIMDMAAVSGAGHIGAVAGNHAGRHLGHHPRIN